MALDKDPWSGMREVTNPRDRSNSSGGFSRDSGMSASNRSGSSVRVASAGGWNFGGGQAASQPNYDPWSGLRSTNRPVTPVTYPATPNVNSRNMALYRNAIADIESAGWKGRAYQAIGPSHPKMGRPLGRYQVMEANLPQWSQRAVGRTVSADEFLSSPHLQNEIFDHRFGGYVEKYGPLGAARAWFAGEGGMNNYNATDAASFKAAGLKGGTSVGTYEKKFARALKREMKNTPNTVETVPRSVRDITGMPGAMAGGEDGGGMGRAPQRTPMQAIGRGIAAGGASLSASANAQGIGRGGLLAGETGGFEQMGSIAIPPVGVSGGVGAAARGAGSVDLAGISMGSPAATASMRMGAGLGASGAGSATMRDMFAGSWSGKTQMDDETLMEVISGSSFGTSADRDSPRRKKLVLKNESYGLL